MVVVFLYSLLEFFALDLVLAHCLVARLGLGSDDEVRLNPFVCKELVQLRLRNLHVTLRLVELGGVEPVDLLGLHL